MRLTPEHEAQLIRERIARKRAAHQSTTADQRDLERAVARQLRAELRAHKRKVAA